MPDSVFLPIDIPTLAATRGLMQMMLAGLLVYIGSQHDARLAARWWAAGFLLNGVSLFLFAVHTPNGWDTATTVLNHLCLGASSACFLVGFWIFGHQRVRPSLLVLILLFPLASVVLWELLWPNARWRVLCTAAGQATFLLVLQHSLARPPRPEIALIYRRLRIIVLVYFAVFVWSYINIAQLLPTAPRMDLGYHRTIFSVSALLFMLSLAVACLALQFALLAARNVDLAMVDWLTGLLNRRGFFRAAGEAGLMQPGRVRPLSVIMLDIDHFKAINDRNGHAAGDRVLQTLGDCLRQLAQPQHLLARMGGEEFCLLLPDVREAEAAALAETIRVRCADTQVPGEHAGTTLRFTLSAGVCEADPERTLDAALARADEALYAAKRGGRDRVVVAAR